MRARRNLSSNYKEFMEQSGGRNTLDANDRLPALLKISFEAISQKQVTGMHNTTCAVSLGILYTVYDIYDVYF